MLLVAAPLVVFVAAAVALAPYGETNQFPMSGEGDAGTTWSDEADTRPASGSVAPAGLLAPAYATPSDPVTGTLTVVSYMQDGVNGFSDLKVARDAVTFQIGRNTYAAITAEKDNSIQLADVTDPTNPVAIAHVRDSDTRELEGTSGIDVFRIDGRTYVIVTSMVDNGVQIIDVTNPHDPVVAGYVDDTAHTSLIAPIAVDTFVIDGGTYAAVTSSDGAALQIIDVTDPINPVPAGRILDNDNRLLNAPFGVDTFEAGSDTYAIVAAYSDVGIQIVNVTDPYAPTAAGHVGDSDILKLYHAIDVSVFDAGGVTYAIVAGYEDHGVQVINIASPYNPVLAGNITDTGVAVQVDTFKVGGNPYAVFTEYDIKQIGLVDLSDPDNPTQMAYVKLPEIGGALGVEIFETGGRLYVITTGLISGGASIARIDMTVDRPPGLVINQMQFVSIPAGSSYTDAGATCTDETDGDLTDQILITSTVNTAVTGDYTVTYTCIDSAGNDVVATRTVTVIDTTAPATPSVGAPTITVLRATPANVAVGNAYTDAGATCTDEADGDLADHLRTTSDVNVHAHGNYTVTYTCADSDGNEAAATRTVTVTDADAPKITRSGHSPVKIYAGDRYDDAGATCVDRVEGDITDTVTAAGNIDTSVSGQYTMTYSCADSVGNEAATASRTVIVLDPVPMIADGVGDFAELDGASGVAVFERNGSTYAIITASRDDGIQVINVTDPARPAAVASISDDDTLKLGGASGVAVFERNGNTYAIIAAYYDDGVQVINVTDPARPAAVASISDDDTLELGGAHGVAVFERNGSTYAIITASRDDGIQVINVTDPANPVTAGLVSDRGNLKLGGAYGLDVFQKDGSTYAIIAAFDDNGIQVINVTDPDNPTAEGRASDGNPYRLDGALDVAVFEKDNNTYALVTALLDNAVQIVDITNPSRPVADGHKKFGNALLGIFRVAVFEDGGGIHAIVTQNMRDGVRIMNVTNPNNLVTEKIVYDSPTLNLDGARDIATFKAGGSTYAIVTAYDGDGAQIISVSTAARTPPAITLSGTSAVSIPAGSTYADAGATCTDETDGDLTDLMQVISTVNAAVPGDYAVTYTCTDLAGKSATAVRNVVVTDAQPPAFLSAAYAPGSGTITMAFSEPLNSTAHLDRLHVRDAGQSSGGATLDAAAAWSVSGSALNVTLTASQVDAIGSLATPQLDIDQGAVFDLAGNGIAAASGQPITINMDNGPPDATPPQNTATVLEPPETRGPRDIGRITLSGIQPGTIQASWDAPGEAPADYRIAWAKAGKPIKTWSDASGNAYPTSPSYAVTGLDGGEEYKVIVRARYAGTSGDWSGQATVTVAALPATSPPTVDAGANQTVNEGDAVTLSGSTTGADDSLTYLWSRDQPNLGIVLGNSTALSTTFTAPQVTSNTTVTFTLAVRDGNRTASDTVAVTILDVPADDPPDAPPPRNTAVLEPQEPRGARDIGRITLSGIQPGTIQASWEAPSEAPADYRIAWAKAGKPIKTWSDASGNAYPTSPSYAVTGLDGGEEYKVIVRARYAGTSGDWSGQATVTVAALPATSPPTVDAGANQTVNEGDAVTLSGSTTGADDSLTYLWSHDQPNLGIVLGNSTALSTTFTAPQVASNTTVTFTLAVRDGNRTASDTVAVTILDVPVITIPIPTASPDAPQNLAAISTATTVTLTWDPPDDDSITGYKILSRIPATEPDLYVLVSDTGSTDASYAVQNLEPDTVYVFRVIAVNGHGDSDRSNFVRLSTMP